MQVLLLVTNILIPTSKMVTQTDENATAAAKNAVLMPSESIPEGSEEVHGIDFNQYRDKKITVEELVSNMTHMGFQASAIGDAVRIINGMVWFSCEFPWPHLKCCREHGETRRLATRLPFSSDTPPT
jgi:hypothetical protein